MSYYNTTRQSGAALREYGGKAATQDHLILNYLKHHKRSAFTPSEINKRFKFRNWPVTSVRRTLSTFTNGKKGKQKLLEKTGDTKIGPLDRPENYWKWRGTNH